jgi:hypothetical protein
MTVISPVVTIWTAKINIQQFYVLPIQRIYVFCVDLRTNETECLLCGTNRAILKWEQENRIHHFETVLCYSLLSRHALSVSVFNRQYTI